MILLLSMAGSTQAQTFADLTPSIQLVPAKPLYFAGDEVRVLLTVTNLGPDTAQSAAIGMNTFRFGSAADQVAIFPTPAISLCFWDQVTLEPGLGGVGTIRPLVHFPAIPANASVTCEVGLQVARWPSGSYLIGGQVVALGGTVDLNALNNFVNQSMSFGIAGVASASIPSARWCGLLFLTFALSVMAFLSLRRQV